MPKEGRKGRKMGGIGSMSSDLSPDVCSVLHCEYVRAVRMSTSLSAL